MFDEFLISSNTLQSWLKIKSRKDFHDTIKRSYIIDRDYIIVKANAKGIGRNNEKIYMLTPDCAKMLLQSTRSPKGDEIRMYFISIERMLYKYKDIVIKQLQKELKKSQNNMKHKVDTRKNKIYVFKALNTDLTLFKIGRSKDLNRRLLSHNSPLANDLQVMYEYETQNITQVEMCLKAMMKHAQYRKYKEIYQIDLKIIKKLILQCDNDIKLVQEHVKLHNGEQLFAYIPEDI
jgi:phage anti-repressor protein